MFKYGVIRKYPKIIIFVVEIFFYQGLNLVFGSSSQITDDYQSFLNIWDDIETDLAPDLGYSFKKSITVFIKLLGFSYFEAVG